MQLASWHCATHQLGLQPFWKLAIGRYLLLGVASPLISLPANQADVPPEEWPEWQPLREAHLAEIRAAFDALQPDQRVLLFCHDPTALPFLWRAEAVRRRLPQVEQTIIGHLHTRLILWKAGCCREFRPSGSWAGMSAASVQRCTKHIIGGRSGCGYVRPCPARNC